LGNLARVWNISQFYYQTYNILECLIENCEVCGGFQLCHKCAEGYYFDSEEQKCNSLKSTCGCDGGSSSERTGGLHFLRKRAACKGKFALNQ